MDGSGTSFSGPRVVIFSRDPALARSELAEAAGSGAAVVRVSSAYEAAAEMLADPPAALVIDLRALTARHVRMLEIARDRQVEMLAVGGLPSSLTADDLSGVRLTARGDLADAIRRLAAEGPGPQGSPGPAAVAAEPRADRYQPPTLNGILSSDEIAELLSPSEPPRDRPLADEPAEDAPADAEGEYVPEAAPAEPAEQEQAHVQDSAAGAEPDQAPPPAKPDDLLSAEELAALLGDEP